MGDTKTSENLEYREKYVTGEAREKRKQPPCPQPSCEAGAAKLPISEDVGMVLAFAKDIRYCTEPSLGSP